MRLFFAVSVSFTLASSTVGAQEITPPPAPIVLPASSAEPEIALEILIRRALENSPRLRVARENLEAARGRAQSLRAPLGPTLQLIPGFSGTREARDEQIILAQPLDVFGARRASAKVGVAEVRRAEAESRLASRTLEVDVKVAAVQLFAAQEAENLDQVQVEIARLFLDAATKRAKLGDVPPIQAQRAEIELLQLENGLANARAARGSSRITLNTLIGAPPNTPLRVSSPLEPRATSLLRAPIGTIAPDVASSETIAPGTVAPAIFAGATDESVLSDLANRPDLAGGQATLEARQAQVRALGRARLPEFELQLRHAPFFGRGGESTALRAVLTIPLFDLGALKGQRRAAQAEVNAQSASLEYLNQRALAQVESARLTLQSRRENVGRYQTQILPLALELLRKTQIGYAQGASTYLEILDAQRTLRQIQTEYLQALVAIQTGETALDAAINGGLTDPENSTLRGDSP